MKIFFFLLLFISNSVWAAYDTVYVAKTNGKWDKIVNVGAGCPCTTEVTSVPAIVSNKTQIIVNVCSSSSSTFTCSTGSGCTWTAYCSSTPSTTCWKPTIKQVYGNLTVGNSVHVYIGNDLVIKDGGSVDVSGEVFVNGGLTVEGNGVAALEATLTLNVGIFRFSGAFVNDGIVQGTGQFFCCGAFNSRGTCTSGTCGWTANPWGYDACFFGDCNTWINNNSICSGGYVLPLQLVKLGISDGYLEWITVNEENIHSFVIQYSSDGKTFKDLSERKALNGQYNEYYYPVIENGYYRLKIVEENETVDYTFIVSNYKDITDWRIWERDGCVYWMGPEANVDIYNTMGQYITSIDSKRTEVKLEGGCYTFVFRDNTHIKSFKIVIL
jgi:hypothetical protein